MTDEYCLLVCQCNQVPCVCMGPIDDLDDYVASRPELAQRYWEKLIELLDKLPKDNRPEPEDEPEPFV